MAAATREAVMEIGDVVYGELWEYFKICLCCYSTLFLATCRSVVHNSIVGIVRNFLVCIIVLSSYKIDLRCWLVGHHHPLKEIRGVAWERGDLLESACLYKTLLLDADRNTQKFHQLVTKRKKWNQIVKIKDTARQVFTKQWDVKRVAMEILIIRSWH